MSIFSIIAILKLISEDLGLAAGENAEGLDIRRKAIMYHGDYLTVRNIAYMIPRPTEVVLD